MQMEFGMGVWVLILLYRATDFEWVHGGVYSVATFGSDQRVGFRFRSA